MLTIWLTLELTAPESASLQLQLSVTFVLFQPLAFAAGVRETNVMTGAVLSILMPLCVFDAELPALSVQVPIELKAAPSAVKVWLTVGLTAPDVASEQFQLTVTSVLFQPLAFAAGVRETKLIVGLVASRLTVTLCIEVPPVLVAVQVKVMPLVSVETVCASQPV